MRSYVLLLSMRLEVAGKALSSLPGTRNSDFEDLPQLKDHKRPISSRIWTKYSHPTINKQSFDSRPYLTLRTIFASKERNWKSVNKCGMFTESHMEFVARFYDLCEKSTSILGNIDLIELQLSPAQSFSPWSMGKQRTTHKKVHWQENTLHRFPFKTLKLPYPLSHIAY